MVLDLQTANKKLADLETKMEAIEEEKREQNHGELFFTIILYAIPMQLCIQIAKSLAELCMLTFWF